MQYKYPLTITASILVAFFCLMIVDAQEEEVNINANVYGCNFELTVYPERRKLPSSPPFVNYATDLTVEIYNTSDLLQGSFTRTSDEFGTASLDLCDEEGIYLASGTYKFYIHGKSHLRKLFTETAFEFQETTFDFNAVDEQLLAGEVSNTFDNKINSLDYSAMRLNLNTTNDKHDLNQDGDVNSLDMSNLIYNMGIVGD